MHRSLLEILVCPSCRVALAASVHEQVADEIELGFLRCPRCAVVVPVLDGFVMFTEPLLHAGLAPPPALRAMALRLFGDERDFREYRRDKRQRGVIESYAAFAPFNESTRVLEPLLPHAMAALREGDAILDTWCRTGYSGEWLAGRFPRQRVVSLWEGNSSVLGYRGFRHMLGAGQRSGNLDFIFCTLEKPLPFRDGAFGLVHAYDSLHRYSLFPFAGECLRAARDDAAILFPHLHLSNSEPEPFFERGCHQHHGRDYRAWLNGVAGNGQRRGWVMDEARVFNGPDVVELIDEPDTTHYNGMVVILPEPSMPTVMNVGHPCMRRFMPSPLFRIHLARSSVRVSSGLFDGAVGHLLQRHPVYQARLPAGSVDLPDTSLLALLLAIVGESEEAITASVTPNSKAMALALDAMAACELLRPAEISSSGHRLQRFHCNQLPAREGGILEAFWSGLAGCEGELLILPGGDGLSGSELARFAASMVAQLQASGLEAGDWLSIDAGAHPLLLLAAIASASAGFNVRLQSANAPLRPGSKLFLHDDGVVAPVGVPGLPLGLTGDAPSLLSRVALPDIHDPTLRACDKGLVEFEIAAGMACCRLSQLVDALESMSAQIEKQLWLLEGRSRLGDLIACLAGWSRLELVRALPSTGQD